MEFLYSFDLAIFYFCNHTISTGFLDKFFSIITDVNKWYIAYVILAGIAFFKGGRRALDGKKTVAGPQVERRQDFIAGGGFKFQ